MLHNVAILKLPANKFVLRLVENYKKSRKDVEIIVLLSSCELSCVKFVCGLVEGRLGSSKNAMFLFSVICMIAKCISIFLFVFHGLS